MLLIWIILLDHQTVLLYHMACKCSLSYFTAPDSLQLYGRCKCSPRRETKSLFKSVQKFPDSHLLYFETVFFLRKRGTFKSRNNYLKFRGYGTSTPNMIIRWLVFMYFSNFKIKVLHCALFAAFPSSTKSLRHKVNKEDTANRSD